MSAAPAPIPSCLPPESHSPGAGGARTFGDGVDMGGEIPNPISRMANVETIEAQFPIRYLFRRKLTDSGGPGKFRGGAGGEMAIVSHDAPDGGIHYVLSGKGPRFPQSDGLAAAVPAASTITSGCTCRRTVTTPIVSLRRSMPFPAKTSRFHGVSFR